MSPHARLLFALGATVCLTGIVQAEQLNVQLTADIRSSQPGVNRDGLSDTIALNVSEGLVTLGEKGEFIPMLAESWEISEDGKQYTFKLREGVKFHNGETMTAEDVKGSFETSMKQEDFACKVFFDGSRQAKVENVETPDPRTVVFTLSNPDAMFLTYLARAQCGGNAVLHADSFDADGTFIKPIATGPFIFEEWRHGQSIRLVKFDDYSPRAEEPNGYGGRKEALVDEVIFNIVPDLSTAVAALRSGDIDILPYLPPNDAGQIQADSNLKLTTGQHGGLITILFQSRDPLMQNLAFRKAVVSALDVPMLVDTITGGLGEVNNSLVPTTSLYYTDVQKQGYVYDPAAVPGLLEEAGYKGEKLVLLTNRRSPINYEAAVIAQAMLQAVGINSEIQVLEWASQLDLYYSGEYQAMAFNYSSQSDPGLIFRNIIGDKDERPNSIWEGEDIDAMADEALQIIDPAARQAIFDDLHRRFLAELPMVMLANNFDVGVSRSNVSNYRTWQGFARMWNVSVDR